MGALVAASLATTATPAAAATRPTFDTPQVRVGYGNITLTGTAAPGARVQLHERAYIFGHDVVDPAGLEAATPWDYASHDIADGSGRWEIIRTMDSGFVFSVEADGLYSPIVQAPLRVGSEFTATANGSNAVNFVVRASPDQPGIPVTIQRYTASGWVAVAEGVTDETGTDGAAQVIVSANNQPAGAQTYRAHLAENATYASADNLLLSNYSVERRVTVAGTGGGDGPTPTPTTPAPTPTTPRPTTPAPTTPAPTPTTAAPTPTTPAPSPTTARPTTPAPSPTTARPTTPAPTPTTTRPAPTPTTTRPATPTPTPTTVRPTTPAPTPTTPAPTTPAPGPTSPNPTTPAAPAVGSVQFTRIQFNAPGKDTKNNSSINGEYFKLTNKTSKTINLRGWTVRDRAGNVFRFTTNHYLAAGKSVIVRTGTGADRSKTRYWDKSKHVWGNRSDTATLRTPANKTIDTCRWTHPGTGRTSC